MNEHDWVIIYYTLASPPCEQKWAFGVPLIPPRPIAWYLNSPLPCQHINIYSKFWCLNILKFVLLIFLLQKAAEKILWIWKEKFDLFSSHNSLSDTSNLSSDHLWTLHTTYTFTNFNDIKLRGQTFCDIFRPHPPSQETSSLHSPQLILLLNPPPPRQSSSYCEGIGVMLMKDEVFGMKGWGVMSGRIFQKTCRLAYRNWIVELWEKIPIQAGAELCQAQH